MTPETETDDGAVESDEEQIESEWHLWLIGLAIVAGMALFVAPDYLVPGIARGLAPFLVVVGVAGWLIKEGAERWG